MKNEQINPVLARAKRDADREAAEAALRAAQLYFYADSATNPEGAARNRAWANAAAVAAERAYEYAATLPADSSAGDDEIPSTELSASAPNPNVNDWHQMSMRGVDLARFAESEAREGRRSTRGIHALWARALHDECEAICALHGDLWPTVGILIRSALAIAQAMEKSIEAKPIIEKKRDNDDA